MHVYIYDDFLNTRKHENLLAGLETRITDLGLNGKIIRLGNMQSSLSLLKNELRREVKTVVVVGDNSTINKVMNLLVNHQTIESHDTKIPLGIIPIGKKNNSISHCLGIFNEEEACNILAARRIESIDVGQAESLETNSRSIKKYFLENLFINSIGIPLELDQKYSIELTDGGEIGVLNLPPEDRGINSSPKDGKLELVLKMKKNKFRSTQNQSVFSFKKLAITNPKAEIIADNSLKIHAPVEISALKKTLDVIVGKERCFKNY